MSNEMLISKSLQLLSTISMVIVGFSTIRVLVCIAPDKLLTFEPNIISSTTSSLFRSQSASVVGL